MIGTQPTSDSSLPRFLLVTPGDGRQVERGLGRFVALGCPLERAHTADEAEALAGADLVLFDLACGQEQLRALRARLPEALLMVFGPPAAHGLARQALAAGAHEWLHTRGDGQLDQEAAFQSIERLLLFGPRPALPRAHRPSSPAKLLQPRSPSPLDERAAPEQVSAPVLERSPARRAPRAENPPPRTRPVPAAPAEPSPVLRPDRVYEVEADGGPGRRPVPRVEGARRLGGRYELVLACAEPFVAQTLLAAREAEGGARWASFEVTRVVPLGAEQCTVELELATGPRDFFRERALLPTLDPSTMRYRRPELGDRARAWVELGVLREIELDRVLVCPRCQSLPTFRLGCRRCGSACLDGQRLIHHFPCAHVGFIKDYQLDGLLVCPKCAARPLIVNADFEYLDGPAVCAECGSAEADGELVGHCFGCGLRFLSRVAATLSLKGFHAERLDPLDLGLPA